MATRHYTHCNTMVQALRHQTFLFVAAGIFSGVLNVLALTGAFYMLQIYDRVLPSGSVQTLIGLTILMAGLYVAYGFLDFCRGRLLSRIGLRVDRALSSRIFSFIHTRPARTASHHSGSDLTPVRDVDQIRNFLSSTGPAALFDVPWTPLFLAIIYFLHPVLGLFACGGALILVLLTALTELLSRRPLHETAVRYAERNRLAEAAYRNGETIMALGMGTHFDKRWRDANTNLLNSQMKAADATSMIGTIAKFVRFGLQSGILGLGAFLAIQGDVSPGTIIAGSITLSRALAPLDSVIAQWRAFVSTRQSYHRLVTLFDDGSELARQLHTSLPAPTRSLSVSNLAVLPPSARDPVLRGIDFRLNAGDGLGVIGPTASGKSSLARTIVGVWKPGHPKSSVRLDGAAMDQWASDALGRHIGYLPQDVELFAGSVAANIARFDPSATDEQIISAARTAGCHDMIVGLQDGYQTHVGEGGTCLSGGQRQRIALARALFGNPFLVVLDEPNANLDMAGETALTSAVIQVRRRGGIVVVVAHRPAALQGLNKVLVAANGGMQEFGPRDEVLKRVLAQASTSDVGERETSGAASSFVRVADKSAADGSQRND